MPLDVQPLSRTRRAIMLLVMFGLLAGSLGFAEFLVKRQKPVSRVKVFFPPPDGVSEIPVNDTSERAFGGPLKKITVPSVAGIRTLVAYSFDADWDQPMSWPACLDKLYANMTGTPAPAGMPLEMALGGNLALERRVITTGPNARFDILRMTIVDEHVVAFGFSGAGPLTDIDRRFLEPYCATMIRIQR